MEKNNNVFYARYSDIESLTSENIKLKEGKSFFQLESADIKDNGLFQDYLNYDLSNYIIQSCLRETHQQAEKMLLLKLISTISVIEPLCTENTIFNYLPNVQRVLLNQFHDEYYYMLSAEKKQLLFSTKWVTENDGTTFKSIMHVF